MFWIGGEGKVVERGELNPEMYQDRYFLPGIIHGCKSYLINIYLNDSRDCEEEADQFEVNYFTKDLIKRAHKLDPFNGDDFTQVLLTECETFACENNGQSGFAELVDAWPKSIMMSNSDLVDWANGSYKSKS